jgi:thioredoxin 1
MSKVIEVTDDNFEDVVLQSPVPVLVDFYGDYCSPCRALKPILAALAADLGEKVKIVLVDVVINEGLAQTWDIAAVPTLIVFKAGRELHRLVGLKDMHNLREALEV